MSQNNDDKPHSYTESAYTTVSSNTHTCGKFEIKSHFDVRLGDPVIVTDETGTYKSWIGGVSAPSESQEEPMFTVEDMEKCFEMGVRFGRDMVNNPSNTEYVRGLYELRKQQLTRKPE